MNLLEMRACKRVHNELSCTPVLLRWGLTKSRPHSPDCAVCGAVVRCCCCCCCFLLYTASAISICVVDCLKPGLEERLFEAGCTVSRSSTTALPCLQLENSQHSELSNCWAWSLNLLLPIMVLVSKGFVSWMMLFNAG